MSEINKTIKHLKNNDQDFEFYPTTQEILDLIKKDMFNLFTTTKREKFFYKNNSSKPKVYEYGLFLNKYNDSLIEILDIGAGNGDALNTLGEFLNGNKFTDQSYWKELPSDEYLNYNTDNYQIKVCKNAIEKSHILTSSYKKNRIKFVGTDFFELDLQNKKYDVIFSNPPYSIYKSWINHLLLNILGKPIIYLVIPTSWKTDERIVSLLSIKNGFNCKTLGIFNFKNAERIANVEVDILKIEVIEEKNNIKDDISKLFESNFKKTDSEIPIEQASEHNSNINEFKNDYANFLFNEYNKEIETLNKSLIEISYVSLSSLQEIFEMNLQDIILKYNELRKKIKHQYWNKIIQKVCLIEKRMIKKYRDNLMESIIDKSLDFNLSNIYFIISEVIKISSENLNKQTLDVYNSLLLSSPVEKYKSNKRMFVDNNVVLKDERIKLTPRIVIENGRWKKALEMNYKDEATGFLSSYFKEKLSDLMIVFKNIGFDSSFNLDTETWIPGKNKLIKGLYLNREIILMEVKPFLNGNVHIKLNKEVLLKFNVIKGLLEGWINNVSEITDEFDIDENTAIKLIQDHINNRRLLEMVILNK